MKQYNIVQYLVTGLAFGSPSLASVASAQTAQATTSPMIEIKNRLMYINVGLGEGLCGVSASQNGEEMDLGFLGGNVERFFSDSPDALEQAESYAAWKRVGFSMWSVGMVALLADVGLLTYVVSKDDRAMFEKNKGVLWGLFLGGAAVGVPGAFVFEHANTKLVRAVNLYNAGLMNRHLPDEDKIDFKIFLTQRGMAAGLALNF